MNEKHTPGPWKVAKIVSVVGITVWRGDEPDNSNYKRICRNISNEVDARLIASAPDLLAERDRLLAVNAELVKALEGMVALAESLDNKRVQPSHAPATNQARAALSRAKGE